MTPDLEAFAERVAGGDFDLARACLEVAEDEYPGLDVDACLAQLDAMAATVRSRLAADAFPEQRVAALNHHLFGELGFRGNADAYYDPRNSYLNEVLARRTGIPITLAVVYMEVGRRVGLALHGVSFPGHFMVKLRVRRGDLVLDPFACGVPRGAAELRQRLRDALPQDMPGTEDLAPYLAPTPHPQILARVLRNLKAIYVKAGDADRALAVMNRMLAVVPDAAEELRDRGLIYADMGAVRAARADLQGYLDRRPEAPDVPEMRARVAALHAACARLN
jgi:regulator of sirC expression with transglutaminase-like and TPR domain